ELLFSGRLEDGKKVLFIISRIEENATVEGDVTQRRVKANRRVISVVVVGIVVGRTRLGRVEDKRRVNRPPCRNRVAVYTTAATLPVRCRVAVVLGGRGVDANLRILQVQETGWRIVGSVALPNRARKRHGVVQFPWEFVEGSV
ncbi:hypothetical protein Taro_020496, partial [Colocasia esculenta]|nr:hypothetical protein [Colocasia esculenta]